MNHAEGIALRAPPGLGDLKTVGELFLSFNFVVATHRVFGPWILRICCFVEDAEFGFEARVMAEKRLGRLVHGLQSWA